MNLSSHTAVLRVSIDCRVIRNLISLLLWKYANSNYRLYPCGNKAELAMTKLNVFYWPINHCGQTFAPGYKKAKK